MLSQFNPISLWKEMLYTFYRRGSCGLKQLTYFAEGHISSMWQSQNLNPGQTLFLPVHVSLLPL